MRITRSKLIIRFFVFFVFFAALFLVFSLKKAEAHLTGDMLDAVFQNNGVTSVTLNYGVTNSNNQPVVSGSRIVSGGTSWELFYENSVQSPSYTLTWSIDCYDPPVQAINGFIFTSYTYGGQVHTGNWVSWGTFDISCPAAPTGLIGSCDASNNLSFSWNNTVHTQFDVNVDDAPVSEGGPGDTYHLKTAANSYSRSGEAGHTYSWWIHTLYNSRWSASTNGNTVTCAQRPPEPTRNNPPTQSCNGTNVNATFSWNTVSGATYRLDIWDPNGVWTANSHEGGGATGWAYQDTGGSTSWTWNSFPSNSGQTWTARAYKDGLWSDIATWSGFTTSNCTPPPAPTPLSATPSCPFAVLQGQFNWPDVSAPTGYELDVATNSSFTGRSTKTLSAGTISFLWSSTNQIGTLSPAYSTTYYSRVRGVNGAIFGNYSSTTSFTTQPSGSCTPPKSNVRFFIDKNSDGLRQSPSEDFGYGGNAEFSSSNATLQELSVDITSNVKSDGTAGIRDLTPNTNYRYIVTPGASWVRTQYVTDKALAAPVCSAGSSCAYSASPAGATGFWNTGALTNVVWNLDLGIKPTTSTMNVTVFYDKNANGVVDAGENFSTTPTFGSSVAQIIENGPGVVMVDKTASFSTAGVLPPETVNAGSFRQFQVNPAVGWVVTTWRSDKTVGTCTANTSCAYNQGWTQSYTTPGGETFNFWLGVNSAVPANPGAGPPGTGDCDGTTLSVTLAWTDNATFETGYYLEVYSNSTYSTLVGTKAFAANVSSFIWKNPGAASEKLDNGAAPAYGANYWWRIRAVNNNSVSSWVYPTSNGVGQTTQNNNPASMPQSSVCTSPADPTSLSVSSSCSSGILTVNFSFTDNATNEAGYIIDVTTGGNATTWASTWGGKYLNANTSSFAWKNTATESDLLSFPDADPNTSGNQVAPAFGVTYRWRVVAYNVRDIQSNHKYPANTTTPTGTSFSTPSSATCSAPSNPSNLSAVITCVSGLPTAVRFNWQDNANNETDYIVDVNSSAWTGDASPSPWGYKSGLGANATSFNWTSASPLTNGPPTVPVNSTTYYWRLIAYNSTPGLYSSHVYPDGGAGTTAPPGIPLTVDCRENLSIVPGSFTIAAVDPGQTATANLTVRNTGGGDTPVGFKVALNKNSSTMDCATTEDGFVNTAVLAGGATRALVITFTAPATMGNYTAVVMADADCAVTESSEADNTLTTTYTVRGFDLSFTFNGTFDKTVYDPVTAANGSLTVTNSAASTTTVLANTVSVGFWPDGTSGPTSPVCSGTPVVPQAAPLYYSFPVTQALAPGASVNVALAFTTPAVAKIYTAKAYVIPNCSPIDVDWSNNSGVNLITVTYSVSVRTWFETQGGDVGSRGGSIEVGQTGKKVSGWLLVGSSVATTIDGTWELTGYNVPLFPSGTQMGSQSTGRVYDYFRERYLENAKKNSGHCTLDSLTTANNGLNYCKPFTQSIVVPISAATLPADGNYVWFIDGKAGLTPNNIDLSSRPNLSLIIITADYLLIPNSVTRMDGIFISGNYIKTISDDSVTQAPQLVVNGALYARDLQLKRVLGPVGGNCLPAPSCDNSLYPAEKIIFDPKYYLLFNTILGSPGIGWQESAP